MIKHSGESILKKKNCYLSHMSMLQSTVKAESMKSEPKIAGQLASKLEEKSSGCMLPFDSLSPFHRD